MKVLRKIVLLILLRKIIRSECKSWFFPVRQAAKTCKIKKLTYKQIQAAQQYYEEIWGKKISLEWHEYSYSMKGDYFIKIIPEYLYFVYILPFLNDTVRGRSGVDKNLYDVYLHDIIQPRSILKNMNGFYYAAGNALTEEEAITLCHNLHSVIIKPTIDSWCGLNVCKCSVSDGVVDIGGISVGELFQRYGRDFIIQEVITQHPVLASLNPTSVNTVRIVTYRRLSGEVVALSSVVRVGRSGEIVDNGHAGGFCCGIQGNGWLKEYGYAFISGERKKMTDNGTVFKNVQIPQFDKVLKLACQLHKRFPYLRLIGWDFTINDHNEVVFIELNDGPGIEIMQLCNGPVFGDYTDEILQEVRENKFRVKLEKEIIR